MKLTLPYPPTANKYWGKTRSGRTFVTHDSRAYRNTAALMAHHQGARPMTGSVKFAVNVYRPARRGDLDNSLKILIDALRGIAFEDDNQVAEIHARRFEDKDAPRVEVEITKVMEAPCPT